MRREIVGWKYNVIGSFGGQRLPGLERKADISVFAGGSDDIRAYLASGMPGESIGGYAAWSSCRSCDDDNRKGYRGGNRDRRWHYAGCKRRISGILGKYVSSYDGAVVGGMCGTGFDCHRKKRKGLQIAISAVFAGGISVTAVMKKVNASLTVEASLIFPLILLVFVLAMSGGIQMYEECRDEAAAIGAEGDFDTIKWFYKWQGVGEIIENEDYIQ